jgi:hypothetical protein
MTLPVVTGSLESNPENVDNEINYLFLGLQIGVDVYNVWF